MASPRNGKGRDGGDRATPEGTSSKQDHSATNVRAATSIRALPIGSALRAQLHQARRWQGAGEGACDA